MIKYPTGDIWHELNRIHVAAATTAQHAPGMAKQSQEPLATTKNVLHLLLGFSWEKTHHPEFNWPTGGVAQDGRGLRAALLVGMHTRVAT